jgi:NADH-quinone oxidoreductase subunit G
METSMIKLEIDGKPVEVLPGTSIIEAAEKLDIYIPRYCYHKHLSVAANCRMCLVEVENVGKPLPACATPVSNDMKVFTQSPKTLDAQRVVMEFLLANHPLDCPICDQGGMCELQDVAMGYGRPYSYFNEKKLSTCSENLGPLIETWMTRCIKCTRCVRFGEEIAGMRELGVVNRGEHSEISTAIEKCVQSELSGNVIDICPVGALTSKPKRYQVRNWELFETPGVALHDCVGSNVYWHMRRFQTHAAQQVMATVPRENASLNETWISDRDRFSYCGLQHEDRVLQPQVKSSSGEWREVTWERALVEAADKMRAVMKHAGTDQIAFLGSPQSSTEDLYLLQKCARALGTPHIDHRLRQQDFNRHDDMPEVALGMSFDQLETMRSIVLLGSDVRFEQPMLAHRIRKAALSEAKVVSLHARALNANFPLAAEHATDDLVSATMQLAKALGVKNDLLNNVQVSESITQLASRLDKSGSGVILLGLYAQEHPQAMLLKKLASWIAENTLFTLGFLTHGANTAGAWRAGALPHRDATGALLASPGKCMGELLGESPVAAYMLMNFEVERDVAHSEAAMKALEQAGLVICLATYATEAMREYADFILPIAPYTESAGTYYNAQGDAQEVSPSSIPWKDSKPAWKVLRVLANFLELPDFDYPSITNVRDELNAITRQDNDQAVTQADVLDYAPTEGLQCYYYTPIYHVDAIVRRSQPLSETPLSQIEFAAMNQTTADLYGVARANSVVLTQAGQELVIDLVIDERMADNVIAVPAGTTITEKWGAGHGAVDIREVS